MNPARLAFYGGLFLALETFFAVMIAMGKFGYFGPVEPWSGDFVSFYAAGRLALDGTPALAYDRATHHALEQALAGPGIPYVFYYYPPVFLIPCALLALLPFYVAHAVFVLATLAPHLLVLRAILGPWRAAWIIPALAFPATIWTIAMGQNAFLNAALLGAATLWLDRGARAGVAIGALAIKPHVAMLTPFMLAANRRWPAFLTAAATTLALAALSAALFGAGSWTAWLASTAGADGAYTTGVINLVNFPTTYAALRMNGAPNGLAYAAQAGVSLALVALVWRVFRRPAPNAAARACLPACTLLAMPVLSFNDQVLAVIAGAWLVRDGARRPLSVAERAFMVAAYPASLFAPLVAELTGLPLALMVDATLAAICLRRAREDA